MLLFKSYYLGPVLLIKYYLHCGLGLHLILFLFIFILF